MVPLYGAHLLVQAMEDCKSSVEVAPSALSSSRPPQIQVDIRYEKQALRERMKTVRSSARVNTPHAATQLRDQFIQHIPLPPVSTLALYHPINDEIDVFALGLALEKKGHKLCLPVIIAPRQALIFRSWHSGDALAAGNTGIPEPLTTAPEVTPQILLMPLLAFDRRGERLGYGGGYYDRTLAQLRAKHNVQAIGVAFAAQEIDKVPTGARDIPLDAIVTEKEMLRFER